MRIPVLGGLIAASILPLGLTACGGSGGGASSNAFSASGNAPSSTVAGTATAAGTGALSAEAQSKATGDIPDSQVFLSFADRQAGYSLRYPEGWAQQGAGADVTFRDKNNIVHVRVSHGPVPTPSSIVAELALERKGQPSLTHGAASTIAIQGAPVVKVSYSTLSPPNPVTNKRVQLLVDRYVYARSGKVAILDLGTARGVDNVDAYKTISRSFHWR